MCQNATAAFGGCAALDIRTLGRAARAEPEARDGVRGWRSAVVASVGDASDLLDQLEACGVREREFGVLGESKFEVRWR
jgi:hypothetical protein